jgi:hypothetical protein
VVAEDADRLVAFIAKLPDQLRYQPTLVGGVVMVAQCQHLALAAVESFFSLLQKNVLDTQRWETREELRLAIVIWIETKCNRRRRQRALGKLTPVEFEMIYTAANAA